MRAKFLALAAAPVLIAVTSVFAVTILPVSEEELTRRATVIVVGNVQNVEARFDAAHTNISTYVTIRVTEILKGAVVQDHLTLRQMGGTVGEETVMVPGSPEWELGEEVLIFAGPLGDTGHYAVLGIHYGKYSIHLDPATGTRAVDGPSFKVDHVDPETFQPLPRRERPEKISLEDFLSEIRSYIVAQD